MANESKTINEISASKNDDALSGKDEALTPPDLERQPQTVLNYGWVEYFCIVGIDRETRQSLVREQSEDDNNQQQKKQACTPRFLDCYPAHQKSRIPKHFPTICFPQGCYALLQSTKAKNNMPIPEPSLCSFVLTTGEGHRLYLTVLTVYEQWIKPKGAPNIDEENQEPEPPSKRLKISTSTDSTTEQIWWIPKGLVLVSSLPYFQAQTCILRELYHTVQSACSPLPLERYVAHVVEDIPLPTIEMSVEWTSWIQPPKKVVLKDFQAKGGASSVSLEPLFRTVSLSNILVMWATLLQEGKLVLTSSNPALLTPITEALLFTLYPLEWQGIYIPILPSDTLDILEAPVPYVVGYWTPEKQKQSTISASHIPVGVIWCDLDQDVLHLGCQEGDGSWQVQLPAVPHAMKLKTELEEIADELYLPTVQGIQGQMTVGDGSFELENALREPYAQRIRLFGDKPPKNSYSRSYILAQASKVPPLDRQLMMEDYIVAWDEEILENEQDANRIHLKYCNSKRALSANKSTTKHTTGRKRQSDQNDDSNDAVAGDQSQVSKRKKRHNSMDNEFFKSIVRSQRYLQAHSDRLLALFGAQEYASPSIYASQTRQIEEEVDIFMKQDEIAARFFSNDDDDTQKLSHKVRKVFLHFFVTILSRYRMYWNEDTRLLNYDRFVKSLRIPKPSQEYIRQMLNSQMMSAFLQDQERRTQFEDWIQIMRQPNQKTRMDDDMTVIAPPPCGKGIPKNQSQYGLDRRFPDTLNEKQCISNKTAATKPNSFWESMLCGEDFFYLACRSCCRHVDVVENDVPYHY